MSEQVLVPEMMLRFTCNQQGCCCKGWRIPFSDQDLVGLMKLLEPDECTERMAGLRVFVDKTTKVVEQVQLATVGEDFACQFLEGASCGLQRRYGAENLPRICQAFPAHAQPGAEASELHFDAVCPEVLEQLDEDDAPFQLAEVEVEPGSSLEWRARYLFPLPAIHIGERTFEPTELWTLRRRILKVVEEEGGRGGAAIDTLARISYAMARLVNEDQPIDAFEIREGEPVQPFEEHFEVCMRAHHPVPMAKAAYTYRRFVFAIELEGLAWEELVDHLAWRPEWREGFDWREPELQPLMLRFLGHRFFSSFDRLPDDRQLGFNYGTVTHGLATAMRFAMALRDWTGRERVDRDVLKVALGMSEFMYRSWRLPAATMPWFGLTPKAPTLITGKRPDATEEVPS
ncbi:MAG: hypothetical protein CMH57_15090 [Myxococcales bacterium]|nr:hypothetical protein [Myxococcales bacterium]